MIKPYPAEASIDPGAQIIDPAEADLAFQERYEFWLKRKLSYEDADSVVAELVLADGRSLALIAELAQFLRHNRNVRVASTALWSNEPPKQFIAAVQKFETKLNRLKFREDQTAEACRVFVELARSPSSLATPKPSNRALIEAIIFERNEACFTQSGKRRQLRTKGKWQQAAAEKGRSRFDGEKAYDAMNGHYDACHDAFEAFVSGIATELLTRLCDDMQELMQEWYAYKRGAALLDFDDLLHSARDLLARHEEVRTSLAQRYKHVLVDEFQDTDPLQIEILWLLCGDARKVYDGNPLTRSVRSGRLFLVGDPKQAIYRFRGADVNAYFAARTSISEGAFLEITSNFRSVKSILDFVNDRFKRALSEAAGQPGFTPLSPTVEAVDRRPAVAALDIPFDGEKPTAAGLRDAEADQVADLCNRLVGNIAVRDDNAPDKRRWCRFGDIALLAPAGTDLWRFEQALEDLAIPVSTQAGKGFFRRQEVHDLIALTRIVADARDSLALGALLRGPLVGLTDGELLDVVEALPPDPSRPGHLPNLDLRTDATHVAHELARFVLEILRSLYRRAQSTTPYMLLADAVAGLNVRAMLRQRFKTGAERAIANIDLFLEMSRAYDVRGLRAFARDMRANWEEATRQVEGRPDAEQEAVSLITVHAAKGLEWPIVIPINMTGVPQSESALVQDRSSNSFLIPILSVEPTGYADLRSSSDQELARERVRLWYVATTRARDLLVLPRHSAELPENSWARIIDFGSASLPEIQSEIGPGRRTVAPVQDNPQTPQIFTAEAARVAELKRNLFWQRPSRDEDDGASTPPALPLFANPEDAEESAEIPVPAIAGSSTRGLILHKLIEELLNGELQGSDTETRALELLQQLGVEPATDPKAGLSPGELAGTVMRTLSLPEIGQLRSRLVPEYSVFGYRTNSDGEVLISGIADAIAPDDDGGIDAVVDWKSDVNPGHETIDHYLKQINEYRRAVGAKRALLVFMTRSRVIEVT